MNPFHPLASWLQKNSMTPDEKRRMKTALVQYATTHPVKSGLLSPYTFRYIGAALASLVLVLGGSAGLSAAAQDALPTDRLYAVKIFIEEYRAKNQQTPEDIIAFETKRIETRFDEATRLAVAHRLDDATSAVLQSGIEHSRSQVKSAADRIQSEQPEVALAASNDLETAFSSNGKILAAIERNTNQSLGTIVLAAQVTTEKIAMEKAKYEQIVAKKPNEATRVAAEAKLAFVEQSLPARPEPAAVAEPVADDSVTEPAATATATMMLKTMMVANPDEPVSSETDPISPDATARITAASDTQVDPSGLEPAAETKDPNTKLFDLVDQAKEKMEAGEYSEALVILGKAEQLIKEDKLTTSLEVEYQVETDVKKQ